MNIRKKLFSRKEKKSPEVREDSPEIQPSVHTTSNEPQKSQTTEAEGTVDKKKSEDCIRFSLKFNQLYLLENRYFNRDSLPDECNLNYTDFTLDGAEAAPEEQLYIDSALQMAKDRLKKVLQNETAAAAADEENAKALRKAALEGLEEDSPEALEAITAAEISIAAQEPTPPEPIDWDMALYTARDSLTAWIFLFPPLFGGEEVNASYILNRLDSEGIVYGVEKNLIEKSLTEKQYFKMIPVAHGTPANNGENGKIVDHFPREHVDKLEEQADSLVVDYKDLDRFQKVPEGELLCDIIPPTEGSPGVTIKDTPIKQTPGIPASIPSGTNTVVTEDGTQLLAAIDGQLEFYNGMFHITPITTIHGDVDYSTGNIDVNGDVLIYGDVLGGFSVQATGNIQVNGAVEDAVLVAGGNIVIKQGMNGNDIGSLSAVENVHCRFLEHATVSAGNMVNANSLINCNISCNGKVIVKEGKGIIVGGTIMAGKSIEAQTIGNLAHGRTVFTIGSTVEFLQEKSLLEEEVRSIRQSVQDAEKNVRYIEKMQIPKEGQLADLYETLTEQLKSQSAKLRFKELRLAQMEKQQHDYSKCYIKCQKLHPVSYINIGGFQRIIEDEYSHCYFYLRDNEIDLIDYTLYPEETEN